jgi:hypothetical protein
VSAVGATKNKVIADALVIRSSFCGLSMEIGDVNIFHDGSAGIDFDWDARNIAFADALYYFTDLKVRCFSKVLQILVGLVIANDVLLPNMTDGAKGERSFELRSDLDGTGICDVGIEFCSYRILTYTTLPLSLIPLHYSEILVFVSICE